MSLAVMHKLCNTQQDIIKRVILSTVQDSNLSNWRNLFFCLDFFSKRQAIVTYHFKAKTYKK